MLRFSEHHQWIYSTQEKLYLGYTSLALRTLGELSYLSVPEIKFYNQEEVIFTLEALKILTDFMSPVSSKLINYNERIFSQPKEIHVHSWLLIMESVDLSHLMDQSSYEKFSGEKMDIEINEDFNKSLFIF